MKTASEVPVFCHCSFIDFGYRTTGTTLTDVVFSLFSFHNETMNIWSHLIGLVCMITAGIVVIHDLSAIEGNGNVYAVEIFILSACICFLSSTMYHWFGCLSEACHDNLLVLDLSGVGILIAGSFVPAIYYGFQCVEVARAMHGTLVGFVYVVGLSAPWIKMKIRGDALTSPNFVQICSIKY